MPKSIDLTGHKYNLLTVVGKTNQKTTNGQWRWLCKCECGTETILNTGNIRYGRTKSCGCLQRRTGKDSPAYKHGRSKTKDYYNELAMRQNYGLDYKTYLKMVEQQNGKCAICGAEPPTNQHKKRLNIDHCHATGSVRGLLCDLCNRALGLMRDDATLLTKAIHYLNKYSLAR
jgi:hypothetical protein